MAAETRRAILVVLVSVPFVFHVRQNLVLWNIADRQHGFKTPRGYSLFDRFCIPAIPFAFVAGVKRAA